MYNVNIFSVHKVNIFSVYTVVFVFFNPLLSVSGCFSNRVSDFSSNIRNVVL